MSEEKKVQAPKAPPIWVPIVTFIGVVYLATIPHTLIEDFIIFWFLIIINFGFTYTAAVVYLIFFGAYFVAWYAKAAQTAFLIVNGTFILIFVIKAIIAILKALGAGIPEKVEAAQPTPPSSHIFEEMISETGKLTADFMSPKKTGLVDIPLKKKGGHAIEHMMKKFRELMRH